MIGLVVALLVLALASGCSGGEERLVAGSGSPEGPGSGTAPGSGEGPQLPVGAPGGGPDGLVVSVEVGGGFVPVGWDFRSLPTAVVLEDGTTFSPGATVLSFPGPAVHPVVRGHLDDAAVAELVAAAAAAGLLEDEPVESGEPPIADAPTTTVTVVVDGEAHVTSVYALAEAGGDGLGPAGETPGTTPEQAEARQRVADVVARVTTAVTEAEESLWEPDRYRVLPLPATADPGTEVEPDEREWPLPEVALVEGECNAITGEAAATLRAALADATELTRWRAATGTFSLAVRPVLPHEPGCPA